MKKTLIRLLVLILFVYNAPTNASAIDNNVNATSHNNVRTTRYIKNVYKGIKFEKNHKLKFDAFKSAFYGYLNLVESGKINNDQIISICDFTLSSNQKRLWVIDLKNKKVLINTLVAHGRGTGEEFANDFSNICNSHQSSLGFYITKETYFGNHGTSLRLDGIDGAFNCNAFTRDVVIHGADYVNEAYAVANKRIGRSHGCPAVSNEVAPVLIDKIKNGTCFFIYHTTNNYLASSKWLNMPIKNLPLDAEIMELKEKSQSEDLSFVESEKSNDSDKIQIVDVPNISKPKEKIISSFVIINVDTRSAVTDTITVK